MEKDVPYIVSIQAITINCRADVTICSAFYVGRNSCITSYTFMVRNTEERREA